MAVTDELIERLGGGGAVGLAAAAVVLAPTVFPPVRRGLRGLAKATIIQYLRMTQPRAAVPAGGAGGELARTQTARAPRRGRPAAAAAAPPAETAAPSGPAPRRRGGRPAAVAAAPAEEARPAARRGRPRRTETEARPATAEAPAPAPRARRAQPAPVPAEETRPATAQAGAAEPERRVGRPRGGAEGGAAGGRLNLNTASRTELMRLPRIGAQAADRIIQFREQQGPIRNIRQLRQAEIIPVSAARQIRDQVRF